MLIFDEFFKRATGNDPFPFQKTVRRGSRYSRLSVRFVSIPTLIRMKEAAGRPRDQDDIQHLRWILEDESKK